MQELLISAGLGAATVGSTTAMNDFPVREYINAMARELAQMARWDGDERLALLLDTASETAARPPEHADTESD